MKIGNLAEYKGFIGTIELDEEHNLHGFVSMDGIEVKYTGSDIQELSTNFHNCVNAHLGKLTGLEARIVWESNALDIYPLACKLDGTVLFKIWKRKGFYNFDSLNLPVALSSIDEAYITNLTLSEYGVDTPDHCIDVVKHYYLTEYVKEVNILKSRIEKLSL